MATQTRLNFTECTEQMEKLTILLVALFLLLCIQQYLFTEPFAQADISNATVTMSLSDLLYYGGFASKGAPTTVIQPPYMQQYPYMQQDPSSTNDLSSYLYLKNEMARQFKEHIQQTQGDYSTFTPTNVEPPSCSQGSSYMETVPLKVPASCSH
jgi:hypothetical protein